MFPGAVWACFKSEVSIRTGGAPPLMYCYRWPGWQGCGIDLCGENIITAAALHCTAQCTVSPAHSGSGNQNQGLRWRVTGLGKPWLQTLVWSGWSNWWLEVTLGSCAGQYRNISWPGVDQHSVPALSLGSGSGTTWLSATITTRFHSHHNSSDQQIATKPCVLSISLPSNYNRPWQWIFIYQSQALGFKNICWHRWYKIPFITRGSHNLHKYGHGSS